MKVSKTAMVTGAASGIGKQLCEVLLAKGYRVAACDLRIEALTAIYAGHDPEQCLIQAFDVSNADAWADAVQRTVAHFGRIDILTNVAGIIEPGYIHEISVKEIDRQIDINLKGSIYGCHAVINEMRRNGSGHIINISSMAGIAPIPGLSLYSASKFGIRGFSRAIAAELDGTNIHVSVVCPDAVKTPMLDYQKDKPAAALTFSAPKVLTSEDVTNAVLQLLDKPRPEVWLPWSRGVMASIGAMFPRIFTSLKGGMLKKGLRSQSQYR